MEMGKEMWSWFIGLCPFKVIFRVPVGFCQTLNISKENDHISLVPNITLGTMGPDRNIVKMTV